GVKPEIVFETPLSAVIDAHDAMGQVTAADGMRLAIEKAKKTGVGLVQVRDSNHYGIAGYYAKMAADQDLLGICMTNTEAIMVPTFGKEAMLGTNPIAVAMPAEPVPFMFDAATTVIPRGKLEVYNKQGKPVPPGWILDADGIDSTNPGEVLGNIIAKRGGGILPLGGSGEKNSGHKGYGFGLICELCTGIFSSGKTSNHVNRTPGRINIAQCFWAIDYALFGDKEQIRRNFSVFLDELRQSQKAVGQSRIYVHGDKEVESADEKRANGIPVNEKTLAEMQRIAEYLQVSPCQL
ncbi:MAG TPA: malate dehydrogenase, partial [Clostridiales bacterium]|nr:malate dehydrogenase [Clostridiales bacterium]